MDGRREGLKELASLGFVVVAPNSGGYDGPNGACNARSEWRDLRYLLKFGKRHVRKLIGKHKFDWEWLGLWGYSMGGKAVAMAAYHTTVPVRAMMVSHGARHSDRLRLPSLYLTARGDNSSSPPERMRQEFDRNQADSKVFVNFDHGGHERPITDGSMIPWMARFFACHLSSVQDACTVVYGSGNGSLCESNSFDECIAVSKDHVVKAHEMVV
jgi:dienelactone hydrolase